MQAKDMTTALLVYRHANDLIIAGGSIADKLKYQKNEIGQLST